MEEDAVRLAGRKMGAGEGGRGNGETERSLLFDMALLGCGLGDRGTGVSSQQEQV